MKNLIFAILVCLFVAPSNSYAADINFKENNFKATVSIKGEIKKGDYEKFNKIVLRAYASAAGDYAYYKNQKFEKFKKLLELSGNEKGFIQLTVLLDSNGGEITEAIKIGRFIRKMILKTKVSNEDDTPAICLSACFFIWIAGAEKIEHDTNKLGVHRIYFEKDYYKNITSDKAEKLYETAKSQSESYLKEMGTSASLVTKIFSIPSNEIYYLNSQEVDKLLGYVPYYDELLISRCGSYTKQEEDDYIECNIMIPELNGDFKDMKPATKRKLIKKCEALSRSYLSYLEKAYIGVKKCKNMHDAIETWKRMDSFFPEVKSKGWHHFLE